MTRQTVHPMHAELIEDRMTMRYTCPICQHCVEDGPEGLALVHKGDPTVAHRGGVLQVDTEDIAHGSGEPPAVLH